MSLQNRINRTAQRIDALNTKIKELESPTVKTEALLQLENELEKAQGKLRDLLEEQARFRELGVSSGAAWDALPGKIARAESEVSSIRQKMEQLNAAGQAFGNNVDTDVYRKATVDLKNANDEMEVLKRRQQEVLTKARQTNKEMGKMPGNAKKTGGLFSEIGKGIGTAAGKMSTFFRRTKQANGGLSNLLRTMKQMVLSMAVFQVMFQGIEFVKEGLQNLALYSAEYNKNMSAFISSTAQLKNALAVAFEPILNIVIPILTSLIDCVVDAANAVSRFFAILGGKSTYTKAIKQNKDYAESLKDVSDSADNAQSNLAKFDDLDVLNQGKATSSGGGTSNDSPDGSGFVEEAVGQASDWATAFKDAIENGDWKGIGELLQQKLNAAMESINWNEVYAKASNFGAGLANFLNGLISSQLFGNVGRTIAGGIMTAVNAAFSFTGTFDFSNLGESLGAGINEFFREMGKVDKKTGLTGWQKLGKTISNTIGGITESLKTALETVEWEDVGQAIADSICSIDWAGLVWDFTSLADTIGRELFGGTLFGFGWAISENTIGEWLKVPEEILEEVRKEAKQKFDDFLKDFSPLALIQRAFEQPINLEALGDIFSFDWAFWWFDQAGEAFKTAFDGKRANFLDIGGWIIEGILSGIVGALVFIVEPIARFFMELWDAFCSVLGIHSPAKEMEPIGKNILLGVLEGFTGAFSNIGTTIGNFFSNVLQKFLGGISSLKKSWDEKWTGLKDSLVNIFGSMWGGIKKPINALLGGIEKMVNSVISGINSMIRALNKLSFDIPDWVPIDSLAGKTFGLNISELKSVSIPRLAGGGVTTGSTLAEIGEAGREAVLPLERDTAWADIIADRLAARLPDYSAPTQIVMELDGKVFARGELPYFEAESRRIGVTLKPA